MKELHVIVLHAFGGRGGQLQLLGRCQVTTHVAPGLRGTTAAACQTPVLAVLTPLTPDCMHLQAPAAAQCAVPF